MANSSQTRLAEVAETTFGTTPATPSFNTLRFVPPISTSPTINTVRSSELRADRNLTDIIQVGETATFDMPFELSYGSYDEFMESLMYNTWSTDVLTNGVTEKSHTIEATYELGATDAYHRFKGSIANTMSLQMDAQSIVTGSFSFVCREFETDTAIVTGATYAAVNTNEIIETSTGFASLSITGITDPAVTSLSLNITNNITPANVLGSKYSREAVAGQFNVTGTLTLYFENDEAMGLALNDTTADLVFTLGGASNYEFDMQAIKLGNPTTQVGGIDQPLLIEVPFEAIYNATDDATLKITRTTA